MTEQPKPAEAQGPTAMAFGVYYPKGYVVAVHAGAEEASAAAGALREAGFHDVQTWTGEQVLTNHEQLTRQRSALQRLESLFASDEKEALDAYLEGARRGQHFVTVFAPGAEEMGRARQVLAGHGARHMHHYGDSVMTDLSSHPAREGPPV